MNILHSRLLGPLQRLEAKLVDPDPYVYEKLQHTRCIRLLRIPAAPGMPYGLLQVPIQDPAPYMALSYTWDSPLRTPENEAEYSNRSLPLQLTTPHGLKYVSVNRNLYEALDCITRRRTATYVWADALCINQQDNEEKKTQIPLMGEIYSRCEKVVIWLGRDTIHLDHFLTLHSQTLGPKLEQHLDQHGPDSLLGPRWTLATASAILGITVPMEQWSAYAAFFETRRWFTRAWIVQEVALAPDIEILCGSEQMEWGLAVGVAAFLQGGIGIELMSLRTENRTLPLGDELTRLITIQQDCLQGGPNMNQAHFLSRPTFTEITGAQTPRQLCYAFLESKLQEIRNFDATKPHDKVYAVLGIFSKFFGPDLDPLLIPDYTISPQEVYIRVTWLLLLELPFLSTLSLVEDAGQRRLPDLPSWVPDFSPRMVHNSMLEMTAKNRPNASLARPDVRTYRELVGRRLYLEGAYFDYVVDMADPLPITSQMGDADKTRALTQYVESLLRLCLYPGPPYHDGTTTYEALWRTLVANGTSIDPQPPISEPHFREWLLFLLGEAINFGQDGEPALMRCMDYLNALRFRGSPMFPDPTQAYDVAYTMRSGNVANLEQMKTNKVAMARRIGGIGTHRRVYRTMGGRLGIGPASLRLSDQVWLVNGATHLFLMRYAGTGEQGVFRFVGDTYLHGFMNGEIFSSSAAGRMSRFALD